MQGLRYLAPAAAIGAVLAAHSANAHDVREAETHVHGVSALNVALEDASLLMELESPAADLVGFEHAPQTEEERAAITSTLEALEKPEGLFVPAKAASCKVASASISAFGPIAGEEDKPDAAGQSDHEHDHEEHAEDDHDQDETGHSEFYALWTWDCDRIDGLGSIAMPFFDVFPGAMEVRVRIVTDDGQAERTAKRGDASVAILPLN